MLMIATITEVGDYVKRDEEIATIETDKVRFGGTSVIAHASWWLNGDGLDRRRRELP